MKSIEYVKDHFDEFEKDHFCDRRFTKRFVDFLPTSEWKDYGFRYTGENEREPEEWTEENILKHLKEDTMFGLEKAEGERGISSELMAMVVRAWCKILENDCVLDDCYDGHYHIDQFRIVIEHYGWNEMQNVVHGYWLKATGMMPPEWFGRHVCSVCDNFAPNESRGTHEWLSPICPHCGAKMNEERHEAFVDSDTLAEGGLNGLQPAT